MIELIVLDVDGCMTDGSITYTENGDEKKSFNVKDGLAIATWKKLGKKVAIITGRKSKIVERRAKELNIDYLFQKIKNKDEVLLIIMEREKLTKENIAVIGDDLNDYKMIKLAGLSFTPADSSKHIQDIADITLTKNGGKGAIREMVEIIIKKDNLEKEFIEVWL